MAVIPCYMRTVDAKIRDKKHLISRCQRKEKSQLTLVYPFCVAVGIRIFLWCNAVTATITKQKKGNNEVY
jgi:hypothetical protein